VPKIFIAAMLLLSFSSCHASEDEVGSVAERLPANPPSVHGAPAAPGVFNLSQPGGITFSARGRGDERFNWMETADGYSIEKGVDGYWYYVSDGQSPSDQGAENSRNGFSLTDLKAHLAPPDSLPRHIRPPALLNPLKNGRE